MAVPLEFKIYIQIFLVKLVSYKSFFLLFISVFVSMPSGHLFERAFADTGLKLNNLYQLYQKSLSVSERLKRAEADIEIADARYRQAISEVYPEVQMRFDQRIRDNANFGRLAGTSIDPTDNTTSRGTSRVPGRTQADGIITLNQPIFRGFRDFLLSDAAKEESRGLELTYERQKDLLFLDVAELFFQIRLFEQLREILSSTEKTLKDRIDELASFVKLGKSRESEILASESELADNVALVARTEGFLSASKEALSFLVAIPASELAISEEPVDARAVMDLKWYLEKGKTRPDILAAEAFTNAQGKVATATGRELWPSASFEGNTYPYEDPDRTREWDVLFRVTVPLFDGGRVNAKKSEALLEQRKRDLTAKELSRLTERDVRTAYKNLNSSIKEAAAIKKLTEATRKNLSSQRRDYGLGVVTNIDVLQSIRAVQDAERRLVDSKIATELNRVRLDIAAGSLNQ